MKSILARTFALATILGFLTVFLFVAYWPIQEPYHPLNLGWNGCSTIAGTTQNTTLLYSYNQPLLGANQSLLAIIGPSVEFTTHDASTINTFLTAGGTVILADNFGTGNQLLAALNVTARIADRSLADLYFYDKNPDFPIVTDFSSNPLTANLRAILLNRPSYILTGNSNLYELAYSSAFSFINLNNGYPVAGETITSYPVMVSIKFGNGLLVILADPNVFTNQMVGLDDNMLLFRNLMIGRMQLIIDVTHLQNAALIYTRTQLKNEIGSAQEVLYVNPLGPYIQASSLLTVGLGFSYLIAKKIRKAKPTWKHS